MKKTSIQQIWQDFLADIDRNGDDPKEFATAIQMWISRHLHIFGKELIQLYKTSSYILNINISEYPIYLSNLDISQLRRELHETTPRNVEGILSKLLDILWDFVSYKTKITCPQCGDDELRCLMEPTNQELVLSCDICSWISTLDGIKLERKSNLLPAKTIQLPRYLKYIDS